MEPDAPIKTIIISGNVTGNVLHFRKRFRKIVSLPAKREQMERVTIKDVAKALNVSISSVSRAFNDKYDIKKETRELILSKALAMGYHPNPIARKLISKRSYNIGVVVPEFVNPFFPEVIIGIQHVLIREGYQVLIMQSNEMCTTELENVKTLVENMVDGIILSLTRETTDVDYYSHLVNEGFPLVLFNRVRDELETSKVIFDDYKWAFFATEHLILQGYRRIVHFSGPAGLGLSLNRTKGFQDAHRKYKLEVRKEQIIETGFIMEDGQKAVEKLITTGKLPDAIFAVNDPCAIGAMRTLRKYGIKVPQEVGIVGFSETKMAALIDPPLTSVYQPTFEIGETAAKLLLNQIRMGTGLYIPQTIVLNGKLNVRESSLNFSGNEK